MSLMPAPRPTRWWIYAPEGAVDALGGRRTWLLVAICTLILTFLFWIGFDSSQAGFGRPQGYVRVVAVAFAVMFVFLVVVVFRGNLVARRAWPVAAVRLEPAPAIGSPLLALFGLARWKALTDVVTITVGRGDFTSPKSGQRVRHVWVRIESREGKLKQPTFGNVDLDYDWEGWVRAEFAFVPNLVVVTGPDPR